MRSDALAADASGDELDAVLCLVQAAWAAAREPGYGLPAQIDPLEGWIVSAGNARAQVSAASRLRRGFAQRLAQFEALAADRQQRPAAARHLARRRRPAAAPAASHGC